MNNLIMSKKKAQGLIPTTLVGWLLAAAFLAVLIFIAIQQKDKIVSLIEKVTSVFRFGK